MNNRSMRPKARNATLAHIRGLLYDPRRCSDPDLGLAEARIVLADPSLTHASLIGTLEQAGEFMARTLLNRLTERFPDQAALHRRLALMRILSG